MNGKKEETSLIVKYGNIVLARRWEVEGGGFILN